MSGLAIHACGRHGCFAPGSGVDLQKGERQMNIDYSLSEALKTTNVVGIFSLLLIYDVMCQYYVKLHKRVADTSRLSIPDTLHIIKAIGQFHVHAHQETCLYRFSTMYIPGIGIVDGEILETLWSSLNDISQSTRTATLAHRTEVLDEHMAYSNWKKIINISAPPFFVV